MPDRNRPNSFYYKKGKVTNGKVRYLLNIVFITLRCSNHLFSAKEYSLIGKIRSFKLPVFSSNLSALGQDLISIKNKRFFNLTGKVRFW
jgi:hypothetical protein